MKRTKKETKEQTRTRHAEIERLFSEIERLVSKNQIEKALDLRAEADRLRANWR